MGEESSDQAMVNGGDSEPGEGEVNYAGNSGSHAEGMVSEPYVGMEFDSEDAAKIFYNEYARNLGFSIKAGLHGQFQADGTNMYREFVCSREGLKRKLTESCGAMIRIERKGQIKWVVTRFVKKHSHPLGIPGMVNNFQPLKHFSSVGRTMPETYKGVGLVPSGVMYVSMDGNPTVATAKTSHLTKTFPSMTYTVRHPFQKRTLGRDAHNLLEYFKKVQAENPGFFYAIQLDEDNRMSNVFWADVRSRTAYSHFGDTVTLDTIHRVNQYRVPFTQFIGVNHHGQMILFGCALLFDDSEASVVWLLKTFLAAMNDRHPVSITTDQDRAIRTAVSQVFPRARHCINKWHVLREGQEKVGHVCHMHPNFHTELYNCINLTETIEEFHLSWNSIIDKYELRGNDWLRSLYSARAQWVPTYFRDSFFAVISPNQGFTGSFFDGFVNQHTTLPLFFRQYEVAMEEWFEKEIESDFETICTTPVLKTPSPMESQAANLYTQKIFLKFQEELVETFAYTANRIEEDEGNSIFRVAKFEDDQKSYVVTLNHSELKANCSCQMFEYLGILCRHVLTVFTVSNVFTIPSHYILKRWTREAKISVRSDECAGEPHGHEILTSRYADLCRQAIRYAEEGAVAVETHDAAVNALRDGGKKIAVMKRSIAKVALSKLRVSRNANTDKKTPTSTSDTTPLLWPLRDETTMFNLNDASAPVQPVADLNLPQTASVPHQRVDGPCPTTVPCQQLDGPTTVPHQQIDGPTTAPCQRVDGPTPVPFQRVDGPTPVPFQRVDGPTPVPFQRLDGPSPVHFQRVDGPTPVPFQRVDGPTSLPPQRVDGPPLVPRQRVDSPPPVPQRRVDSPLPVPRRRIGSPSRVTRRRVVSSPPVTRQRDDGPPSVSLQQDDGPPENTVVLPCLKSMTWLMENKNLTPENRVAVINLKLQDNSRGPSKDYEVKFHLSRVTVEPVLKSMAEVSEQISTTANKVAVIHINHEDAQATSGETAVKFQVSRDALGAVLRSMAYIREQLFCAILIFFYMQKHGRAMRSQNLYRKGIKTEASEFFYTLLGM